jgi:hypothetical protein
MVVKDKVSDDGGHSNHGHGPPNEAQPEALPEWNDEERRQDVELHVVGKVPWHAHALEANWSRLKQESILWNRFGW